jgi:hypothetical protein
MTPEAIKKFCKALALVTVSVGSVGSVLCLPFAITNRLDLIGVAGIYFCAGAVLIVGGQIAYAILSTKE